MEEVKTIAISCRGAELVNIDELNDLQGNLKDLSEENYVKLRNSITEYGFSFPVFYWADQEGKKYIIDSHQRNRVLKKMREEGFSLPLLPADPIFAKDKVEAKKKLLLLNSRYGTMTREGFDAFIDEPDSQIGDELEDFLVLPEIEYFDTPKEEQQLIQRTEKEIECPACHHIFHPVDKRGETA